jgi:citrate synthase
VAARLARALGARSAAATRAVDVALIVCADHELNISTFAARVAASGGADVYGCLAAGLGAFSGPDHGRASDRVEALVDEALARGAERAVRDRLSRGERVPGFGHPLYRSGDPRVPALVGVIEPIEGATAERRVLEQIAKTMRKAGHPAPNLDFGLVAMRRALGAPRGAASALFAIGRCAGWIAHVLEQRGTPGLLRPRARYIGVKAGAR